MKRDLVCSESVQAEGLDSVMSRNPKNSNPCLDSYFHRYVRKVGGVSGGAQGTGRGSKRNQTYMTPQTWEDNRKGLCDSYERETPSALQSASIMILANSSTDVFGSHPNLFFAFEASPSKKSTSEGR